MHQQAPQRPNPEFPLSFSNSNQIQFEEGSDFNCKVNNYSLIGSGGHSKIEWPILIWNHQCVDTQSVWQI